MNEFLVIAGSGKMGMSIGDFFLEKGCFVTWVTESNEQYDLVQKKMSKARRRMEKYFGQNPSDYKGDCRFFGQDTLPAADIVIESTSELLQKKRGLISRMVEEMESGTIFCSNSSSYIPGAIHRGCIGTHFFYPVALTPCVEVIVPKEVDRVRLGKLLHFFQEASVTTVLEGEQSPFWANRLLLSLQFLSFQALLDGYNPVQVDTASLSTHLPMGQLAMMDNIGLDILSVSLEQYKNYPTFGRVDFEVMQSCLHQLLEMGKLGKKNRDGLLLGGKLPWRERQHDAAQGKDLVREFQLTFKRSCEEACQSGTMTEQQLKVIVEQVFHCEKN